MHITVFNMMMRLRGYTSLGDFDRQYPARNPKRPMSGPNYGWYQVRFHVLACEIFDEEGGEAALRRLGRVDRRSCLYQVSRTAHRLC
jgi:hypothetical protein